jgi:ribosomal protein S18 acetylase RimI-like enzyme
MAYLVRARPTHRVARVTLRVRDATEADVAAVGSLYVQLRDHHAQLDPGALRYRTNVQVWFGWARDLLADPSQHVRLAEDDVGAVGLSCLEFVTKPWGLACEIHTMIVRDDARGSGVGERLLDDAESLAHERGARGMRVDVLAANEAGRRFYEQRGFKISAIRYAKDF